MTNYLGETLCRLRMERGLTQQELATGLNISRSSIANWEAGNRRPSTATIFQIARLLNVDVALLLTAADDSHDAPNVLIVDDNTIALKGGAAVLREAFPSANVTGFSSPAEAMDYAKEHPVAMAFLDIELGTVSGLDLCQELLRINPNTNVIYLTAYSEYSLDAWDTGACGYLLKPLETHAVRKMIPKLKHPVRGLQ